MKKEEVEDRKLVDCVLREDEEVLTFAAWWKTVEKDEVVEVQYPHGRHGLAGRRSNHAKQDVMAEFLDFVDNNSQPNGRQEGSYSAHYFFLPQFTRIVGPAEGEKNFEEKRKSSVVAQFNRAQLEKGRPTCGNTAAREWLRQHRPKVALHPSMTDYCDTCKHLKEQLSRNQAISNRMQQSGSASAVEMRATESTKADLEEELRKHKDTATKAREFYKASTDRCKQQWEKITQLTTKVVLSRSEKDELESAKHCYTHTISADYQQSKLIPSWGRTEQPGSTYYLQKVSHDILGIVDHSVEKSTVYIFDERIGPKNTDHTISFLTHYWNMFSQQHPWMRRLAIFLDNATSTNKKRYLFSWGMEMVSSGKIDHVHISFMIAGHTKFAPDRLFSAIGSAYKAADVFTIDDLKTLCDRSASTHVEKGDQVFTWRECLGEKYSDLPGIRKFHDFLIVKTHDGNVLMKVRDWCFEGEWKPSPLHVRNDSVEGIPTVSYQPHSLTTEKLANMVTMYDRFIPPDQRPEYLPPLSTTASSSTPASSSSAPRVPPQRRKPSKCSTPGCDGKGHKNPSKWASGHTTRAGCPLAKK
jgi:hypothetical protein